MTDFYPRVRALSASDQRAFAADCAERVLSVWEARYPDDARPRKAVEAARAYARGEAPVERLAGAFADASAADAAAFAANVDAAAAAAAAGTYAADADADACAAAAAACAAAADAATERAWQLAELAEYEGNPS